MILHKGFDEVAMVVWEFGKVVGVSSNGGEEKVLQRLQELESRDRLAVGREEAGVGGGSRS